MTSADHSSLHCAFLGPRRLALGSLAEIARAAAAAAPGATEPLLVFDGEGRQVDLDLRGGPDQAASRATAAVVPAPQPAPARGRGRPQLGVVAREVTLLPRHWEWLAAQPGGASVTLRKLVEEARRGAGNAQRAARERVYRFLNTMAGNLPGYEDAMRALFAGDAPRYAQLTGDWPDDIRNHARLLSAGAFDDDQGKT